MNSVYLAYNNFHDHKNIINSGSGASEFQIILLAKKLADIGFDVTCFNRGANLGKIDNVTYRNYNDILNNNNIDINTPLIFWRFFDVIPRLLNFYNPNKIILWSHDYRGHSLSENTGKLVDKNKIQVVAVSNFHKNSLSHLIDPSNIIVIYNALYSEFYQYEDSIKLDKNAITFGTAWSKGIDTVLRLFNKLYDRHPNFYLNILSPNYGKHPININKPYIKMYNTVRDKKVFCKILQSSLCLVSTEFPETFGCIFAEAYHLKTPVIATNKINGLHEFINNEHICNLRDYDDFEKLLLSFYNNRPNVNLDNSLLDVNIINLWKDLIIKKS